MSKINIGDAVTLKDSIWNEDKKACRQSTVVVGFLPDIKGGVVLAEMLRRNLCWNVKDLVKIK